MLYEMRIYDAVPGKLPALNDRFANHFVGFFKRHGHGILGFWTDAIGTTNRLSYILSFDSMAHKEATLKSIVADEEVNRVLTETERDGPLVDIVHNTLMRLTPYSPEPRITTNIQEWRVYDAMPGKLPALHSRFADHTSYLFKRHGIQEVGYWTEEVGTSNRLVYMLGFNDLGERQQKWAAFAADPDWQKARAESERDGVLTKKTYSTIMQPTPYSPRS